jgi:hypothetical protein
VGKESPKVNESKMTEQGLDDEDRQARFWRRRPDGFAINEKEHIIYVLEFERVSDAGHEYVSETQQLAEAQPLAVTQDLQKVGHSVRVKTQEVQGHHLQSPEHHIGVTVYYYFPIVTSK